LRWGFSFTKSSAAKNHWGWRKHIKTSTFGIAIEEFFGDLYAHSVARLFGMSIRESVDALNNKDFMALLEERPEIYDPHRATIQFVDEDEAEKAVAGTEVHAHANVETAKIHESTEPHSVARKALKWLIDNYEHLDLNGMFVDLLKQLQKRISQNEINFEAMDTLSGEERINFLKELINSGAVTTTPVLVISGTLDGLQADTQLQTSL
jgi:hypothetical protein